MRNLADVACARSTALRAATHDTFIANHLNTLLRAAMPAPVSNLRSILYVAGPRRRHNFALNHDVLLNMNIVECLGFNNQALKESRKYFDIQSQPLLHASRKTSAHRERQLQLNVFNVPNNLRLFIVSPSTVSRALFIFMQSRRGFILNQKDNREKAVKLEITSSARHVRYNLVFG